MPKYPYNHDYVMRLGIGLANCEQSNTTNPASESSYSQAEWEELTEEEQRSWLESELHEWKIGLVDYSISLD